MHSIWSRRWRCNENYLSFEHITDEEHHHTGINLIFYAPLEPSWYRLSKLCPNIVLWHNDQNEQHFSGQNQFRKYKIEAGWIIIGTLNRNLWITFGDYTGILFKCFPVATWIAGNICIKRMNWKLTNDARRMINTQISYLLICGVSLPILEIHHWPEFWRWWNFLFTRTTFHGK